jgi:hypothetical protein
MSSFLLLGRSNSLGSQAFGKRIAVAPFSVCRNGGVSTEAGVEPRDAPWPRPMHTLTEASIGLALQEEW